MNSILLDELQAFAKRRSGAGFSGDADLASRAITRIAELEQAVADYERLGNGQGVPTNGTRTSNDAADRWTKVLLTGGRFMVVRSLFRSGPQTAEQLEETTGLAANSLRPRLLECRRAGWVEDALDDRATASGGKAKSWVLSTAGRLRYEGLIGEGAR